MKALYLALAFMLVSIAYSRDCDYGVAEKAEECNKANFNQTAYHRCCLFDSKGTKSGQDIHTKQCVPLDKEKYDNIKDTLKKYIKQMEDDNYTSVKVSIECKSNYIILSFLSLIILLL